MVDSGFGGLRVAARLAREWSRNPPAAEIELSFFDVRLGRPSGGRGFGGDLDLPTRGKVVAEILQGIDRFFAPQLVVLACNTLCTLLPPDLAAGETGKIRSIIPHGLATIRQALDAHRSWPVLLFATPNTIESGAYSAVPVEHVRRPPQFIPCPCPDLVGHIEKESNPARLQAEINRHLNQLSIRLPPHAWCGLFCTHYEYAGADFSAALQNLGTEGHLLLPGERMVDCLLKEFPCRKAPPRRFQFQIVSRCAPNPGLKSTLVPRLEKIYPPMGEVFDSARHNPELFTLANLGLEG